MKDEGLLDSAIHSPLNTFYYNQNTDIYTLAYTAPPHPANPLTHQTTTLTPPPATHTAFFASPTPSSTQYKLIQTNLPTNTPRVFAPAPQGYHPATPPTAFFASPRRRPAATCSVPAFPVCSFPASSAYFISTHYSIS